MELCVESFRREVINFFHGEKISQDFEKVVKDFFYYIGAYCAELKFTTYDILFNETKYDEVFHLFQAIYFKKVS